ncbi:MAG: haloacid dehalogenase-like hydrolase [Bacteroidetes bacterium]|nr:haloacid dehalogenase-like hydrolase [Bacteroidota bacterium]MCW5895302.1 haloacid dehalogenase-like hydrolase [Bacteroidota bacterium]
MHQIPFTDLINMPIDFSPDLQEFVREAASNTGSYRPVAVFDCDGTIIKGDIGEAMFYYQIEHFLLRVNPANIWLDHPKREELDTLYTLLSSLPSERRTQDRRYLSFAEMLLEWYFDQLAEGRTEKACSDIVKLLGKFSEAEVRQIALATYNEELAAPLSVRKFGKITVPRGIRYISESVALLKELQQLDFDIWAISGSNKWSVQPVFQQLGIQRDHIIGIDLHTTGNTLSPKVQTPVPVLNGKVETLQALISDPPLVVVSDSMYDAPLFEYAVGKKVLINSRMETSYTFFKVTGFVKDESWVVVEKPTIDTLEQVSWPTQQ